MAPSPSTRSTDPVALPAEELNPTELTDLQRAELLSPEIWSVVLQTYAATTKLAVALTDTQGRLLGECHNPQPLWTTVHGAVHATAACPFCLGPAAPCTAVVDSIRTGAVTMAWDGAGLAHVAVPLSLAGAHRGALIAGQVFTRYPEPLPLQRLARDFGISQQQLWHQATRQVPVTQTTLRVFANLLMSLGDAYLGQRYAATLQRDLAATNLRYRLLIDGVRDYALYTIDRAGRVVGWNSGAERMFGYTDAEILGRDSSCLYIPEDIRQDVIPHSLKEADRQGWIESESWRVRKDGGRFFATGVMASLGQGEAHEYGILLRDVTELHRSKEAVRQAQKLESIGVLAGGIAHDFNNLLTGIMGSVNIAKTSVPQAHPARSLLEMAEHSSERAAELTAKLLAYAGKGKLVITSFDLSALVTEMLPSIEASIPTGIDVQVLVAPELPWIEGDAGQVRQIVMNLVENGAEAIGEGGGTVRISTGAKAHAGASGNGTEKPGTDVYVEVKDSGSGMTETTKARMFDPFFTTKFAGRGLGLAAVAGILRGHNGTMDVESIPGEGATFTVFFPAVEPVLPRIVKPVAALAARAAGTILFVDDEPALRTIGKIALEHSGFTVLVAKDGREAVDIFRQNANEISTVLLDMTMPVMGGREAFRLIREIQPDVPVILMTGFVEDIARDDLGAGAVAGFIQKPYSVAKLVAAIQANVRHPAEK